ATNPISVAIGDVNGDGRPDLAVAAFSSNRVSMLLGDTGPLGTGQFGEKTDYATGPYPYSVAIGDVSGDGKPDLVLAAGSSSSVSVLLGNGIGGFGARADFATGVNPVSVAIGDLNGDGRPDLVTANIASSSVSVLPGSGAGGFGARTDYATGSYPYSVAIGDLNGDGRPDLAVANEVPNTVSVLLANGAGGFGAKTDFPTGSQPMSVAIGDVSGDGKLDLVTADTGANKVSVLLGNGAGGFGSRVDYTTGTQPQSVAIGDVSGDGNPDLVVANSGSNTVSVLLGNGAGGFGAKTDLPTGNYPYSVAIGDVNGDGRADLAVANNSNTVSVLLGDRAGGFGARVDLVTGGGPYSVAIGDLSGDGRPDLAVANSNSATVSVLLGLVPTRVSMTAVPSPVVLGSPLTLTATVSVPAPGYGAPTGTVSFFDGFTPLGTSPVDGGVAGLALFAPYLGSRQLSAVYSGDGRLFGSIASPRAEVVFATASPSIAFIKDVPGDQGLSVRLRFNASPFDYWASATPIAGYYVYRQQPAGPGSARAGARSVASARGSGASSPGSSVLTRRDAAPADVMLAGWDYLATVPATADGAYDVVVPTLADSNGSGFHRATIMVRAATTTPSVYYDSAPDSGYSVDNLPPAPPAPFTATYTNGATRLHWGANGEADLWYYRVYRGGSADFVPGAGNLIATRGDTGYVDVGAAGSYYKLSAVDVNGNESPFASLGPNGTTAVPSSNTVTFALEGVRPNPSSGERLSVSFALPTANAAKLELLDVSGRLVAAREVGSLGVGRHVIDLTGGERLPPGLYLLRLTQDTHVRVVRVTVLR
ncbi:MAG: FG-GAP-like repeat-containing protein, partial [Candidatus Eisenbacteria bacterium]